MTRPLLYYALSLVYGIALGMQEEFHFLYLLPGAFLFFLPVFFKMAARRVFLSMILCGGILFSSALYGRFALDRKRDGFPGISSGERVTLRGTVSMMEETEYGLRYQVRNVRIRREGRWESAGKALLYCQGMEDEPVGASYGSRIEANGTLARFKRGRNPGNFDEQRYYYARGFDFSVKKAAVREVKGAGNGPAVLLARFRDRMSAVYRRNLPSEEAGLMSSMALGDRRDLSEDARELFQLSGLIHLLAVSGTHIHTVSSRLYRRLKKRGAGLLFAGILSGTAAVLYGLLCGSSVSTVRAVGMFLILIAGDILGLPYDTLTALGLMAGASLLRNPFLIFDAGFLFSFGAVAAVVLIQAPVADFYTERCRERFEGKFLPVPGEHFVLSLRERLTRAFLSAVMIQIGTLPLVTYLFYEAPVYVFLVNFLVLPLFPFLLILGLLSGFLNLFLPLGFLFLPCHGILYFYEAISDLSLHLPFSRVTSGQPPLILILLYYGLTLFLIQRMRRRGQWSSVGGGKPERVEKASASSFLRPFRILLLMALLPVLLFLPKQRGTYLDLLDVGQGEAIFYHDRSGENLLIDGGSTDVKKVGTYRILPYLRHSGIGSVDTWIITHTDEDHISGTLEMIRAGFPVRRIILAGGAVRDESLEEVERAASIYTVPVEYVLPGDTLHVGDTTVCFLYPDESGQRMEDRNDACLSFLLASKEGFRGIFTGDLGTEGEDAILSLLDRSSGEEGKADFLSAGHHGSKTSSSEEWLRYWSPAYAGISAGANNRYGHPSREVTKRLQDLGIPYGVTMDTGRIRIRKKNDVLTAEPFLSEAKEGYND